MTTENAHHSGHGASDPTALSGFSPEEVAMFQTQDRKAASAIIGLMACIFLTGILLYSAVCYAVAS